MDASVENQQSPAPAEATPPAAGDFTWQASEYVHHDKQAVWYLLFGAGLLVLVGILAWARIWTGIAVLLAMAAVVVKYARREPRVLTYSLGASGLTIDGKLYPYNQFKSFGVVREVGWHAIDLEPVQRFMLRIQLMIEDSDLDRVVAILSQELPRVDRAPDVIDRLARTLRF